MSTVPLPTPLVSTAWLADHVGHPSVKVIDASAYLASSGRDARAEYLAGHIPGAVFCDLDWISSQSAALPHMLPSADDFAQRIGSLGVGSADAVVVYDSSGQNFSAPRLWWMFRTFGHDRVAVLDGGLHRWKLDGRPLEVTVPEVTPARFEARLDPTRVRDLEAMQANLNTREEQVVDARSPGRFAATEPEPRPGIRGGHIPGSRNLHYATLVAFDGTLRTPEELRAVVAAAGIDEQRPIVTTCGSGVTACSVALALDVIGARHVAVYDGSWTEWGGSPTVEVETGGPEAGIGGRDGRREFIPPPPSSPPPHHSC